MTLPGEASPTLLERQPKPRLRGLSRPRLSGAPLARPSPASPSPVPVSSPLTAPDETTPPLYDRYTLSIPAASAAHTVAKSLRIVAISDTHGFHDSLVVPDGDVLIHCGDFAANRSPKGKHALLDQWLADLPHPRKIVVRGNHDQYGCSFPISRAKYAVQPDLFTIDGLRFALSPYGASKQRASLPTEGCDVLVSHYPPYGSLDVCYNDKVRGQPEIQDLNERR